MKKLAFALAATAAFAGQAIAADMPARVTKAPPIVAAPVVNWTGCYVGGGGGYGLWNQESTQFTAGPPRTQIQETQTVGGRGYFGTVQGGCDYQFAAGSAQFVIGAYGDYDFASMKGRWSEQNGNRVGTEKLSSQWSVGGRLGWLVTPSLLTYFSAGYTEATFDAFNINTFLAPPDQFFDKQTYKGWYIGAGDEYAINFLPGLFWKTEYRFSDLGTGTMNARSLANGALTTASFDTHKWVHTVRSELVYRFNWGGGPVVAKY